MRLVGSHRFVLCGISTLHLPIDGINCRLHEFFTSVKFDAECRVIVLSGSGRAFTAGLDLASGGLDSFGPKRSETSSAAENALHIRYMGEQWQNSLSSVAACGKCVVAAIHGPCIGAGVELISACDIRWCSKVPCRAGHHVGRGTLPCRM